jgi:hypothetical protein
VKADTRIRALERLRSFTPKLPSAGETIDELLRLYVAAEAARDLLEARPSTTPPTDEEKALAVALFVSDSGS